MSARSSSLTSSSPFASMGAELLAASDVGPSDEQQGPREDDPVDVLEDFGETPVYEDDADLDPLSAMEKYCRSDLPQQRLAYAAGMGAAVELLQPHEVSGTVMSLLRELLGDVYADVRMAALQQALPIARRLRSAGTLYQSDIEHLWDLVQKLLLDADVENQEAASGVLAELSHIAATGNAVVASQKLVLAVQKMLRLPADMRAEGALAALRLIAEVVAPRQGSPLTFATVEEFSVGTFKSMIGPEASPDVRQAVVLLLPQFAQHMPGSLRASLLPGWVKALAADSHWNVRAEVPQLLVNLLTPRSLKLHEQQHPLGPTAAAGDIGSSGGSSCSTDGRLMHVLAHGGAAKWHHAKAGAGGAAPGSVADSWGPEDLRLVCEVLDRLCRDTSLQVKVAALASLGQLLPLLPAKLVAGHKPPLLAHFASTAKPPAQLSGVKVPLGLCTPRLSGHAAALRHRQRQQRRQQQRAAEARDKSYKQALHELVKESDAMVKSSLQKQGPEGDAESLADAGAGSGPQAEQATGLTGPDVSSPGSIDQQDGQDPWLLRTASDTPAGSDDTSGPAAAGADAVSSSGAAASAGGLAAGGGMGQSLQQGAAPAAAAAGTAAAELPCACALHIGKVAVHAGPECWPHLQGAFLELAVAAVNGHQDVAAALLLSFPDLVAALGHPESSNIVVPVMLELLHTHLDATTPVLAVMLLEIVSALPPDLRICLLQLLPNLVLQMDPELAGDWRARQAVAEQLSAIAGMVSSPQVAYCLWPLLLSLARDPVFAVRAAAAQQAGQLLVHLPDEQQPAEQGDAQKAAAAAAALKTAASASSQDASAGDTAEASSSTAPVSAASEAAEHEIAAVVATHAVGTGPQSEEELEQGQDLQQQQQQLQQQQGAGDGGPGQRLRWMRRGLTSGLSQLQQQVDRVMDSSGLQKALNGMDQQLSWLQQHPHGKTLWSLGSKLAQGVRGSADAQQEGQQDSQVTPEQLRQHLTSLQLMESAQMDPCKFLVTPAWHTLAAELTAFSSSNSSADRIVFVIAAGGILSAQRERQQQQQLDQAVPQQQHGPAAHVHRLLQQLEQLSSDPAAGVRCAVATVVWTLLSRGAFVSDMALEASSSSSSGTRGSCGRSSSTTTSSTCSPAGSAADSSTSPGCSPSLPQQHPADTPNCSAGGVSSVSSSIIGLPTTALAVLQDCLQRLRMDPCVSVAETARLGGGQAGNALGGSSDAGVAVAAAAAADAAALASSPPRGPLPAAVPDAAAAKQQTTAGAADLL